MILPSWQRLFISTSLLVAQHPQRIASSTIVQRMSSSSTSNTSSQAAGDNASTFSKPIVQYIFCRRDLADEEGNPWPLGAVSAQVAHASVAAIAEGLAKQDAATQYYISPEQLPRMTKYVYGVDSADELEKIQQGFEEKFGKESFHCWLEQPENVPTALASLPMERTNQVSKFVQKLKLSYL